MSWIPILKLLSLGASLVLSWDFILSWYDSGVCMVHVSTEMNLVPGLDIRASLESQFIKVDWEPNLLGCPYIHRDN